MQKYLDEVAPDKYDVDPYPGENIKKLLTRALRDFDPDYHKTVMIMGGICSLTHWDKTTRNTHIRSYDIDHSARKFRRSANTGLERFYKEYPQVPVVIVPTVGIDLARYNRMQADQVEQ